MDKFEVRAKSTTVLQSSSLVDELSAQAQEYKSFPVIIDGFARTFHEIRGGWDSDSGKHLVKLVQKHDNMAEPLNNSQAAVYEIHLNDSFLLYADAFHQFDNEDETVLCIGTTQYDKQEHSFKEQMQQPPTNAGYNWVSEE